MLLVHIDIRFQLRIESVEKVIKSRKNKMKMFVVNLCSFELCRFCSCEIIFPTLPQKCLQPHSMRLMGSFPFSDGLHKSALKNPLGIVVLLCNGETCETSEPSLILLICISAERADTLKTLFSNDGFLELELEGSLK